ncbi:MAG TPA: roadblock/LC7 domain-containing protein [Longimicrobiales bacterium]|nr:roadblock/LC7 domain-containing protein [Longimicrobiales bacterium]
MSDPFSTAVERLSRVPGVRGALIAEAEAGVPVASELMEGVNGAAVAALAASMFRRLHKAGEASGFGALTTLQLEADDGHVVVTGAGDLVLVTVADRDAQVGMVRLEALRAAETLA